MVVMVINYDFITIYYMLLTSHYYRHILDIRRIKSH